MSHRKASQSRTHEPRPERGGGGSLVALSDPAAPRQRRLTGWRARFLRLALVIVSPLLVLGLAEAALRLAGYGYPTDFFLPTDDGRSLTANPRFAWRFCPPATATEPDVFRLAADKPAGTCRIFVLGESAAWGTPDPSYSLGRVLEAMLRERRPTARLEVVNAALMGVDSHGVRAIARDCARRQGDVFVVYMGNNEYVGPCSPCAGGLGGASLTLTRAGLWAKTLRLGQALADAGRRSDARDTQAQTLETFLAQAIPPDDPRRAAVEARFRANLADVLADARAGGARAVVATVAVNLRDCAPLASVHRAGLSQADRRRWEQAFGAGEAAALAGEWPHAAAAYADALRLDDRYADGHWRLARCLLALGRTDEARRHFLEARDLDALPFRATGVLNGVIRQAAAGHEAEGVWLVDAEQALAAAGDVSGGLPGEESFYEHVHFTFEGTYRLASALLPAVEAALPEGVRREAAGPVPSLERCAERLALTGYDRLRLAVAMADTVAKPPFTNQSDHAWRLDRMRRAVAALGRQGPDAVAQDARTYQAALARAPDDWRLHLNFAALLFDAGNPAAAAGHWRTVLSAVPEHLEARVRLGEALARLGRHDEAADRLTEALRLRPDCLRAYMDLASSRLAQGRTQDATAAIRQALAIRPDPAGYRYLGDLAAHQGHWDEAAEHYRLGLELAPDDPHLHQGLASALLAREEFGAAVEHFQAALRADPEHIPARCGLVRALVHLGRTDEAVANYRVAATLAPSAPPPVRDLARLLPADLTAEPPSRSSLNAAKAAYYEGLAAEP
jgi:tetratricopeptide (TPR) repeat protein